MACQLRRQIQNDKISDTALQAGKSRQRHLPYMYHACNRVIRLQYFVRQCHRKKSSHFQYPDLITLSDGIYLLAFFLVPVLLLAFCNWALEASCSVSCIISGLLMYLVRRNRQISGFARMAVSISVAPASPAPNTIVFAFSTSWLYTSVRTNSWLHINFIQVLV